MIVCNLYHCENKAHNNKNNNNFLKVLQTVSSARNQKELISITITERKSGVENTRPMPVIIVTALV